MESPCEATFFVDDAANTNTVKLLGLRRPRAMGSTAEALQHLLKPLLEVNLEATLHLQLQTRFPLTLGLLLLLKLLLPAAAASCSWSLE